MPTIIEDDASMSSLCQSYINYNIFVLEASRYIVNGFAALQIAIDQAFIKIHTSEKDNKYKKMIFSIQQFPDPPQTLDSGLNQFFIYFLPLITIFSFIFLFPAVVQRVGEDTCSGTKVIINTLVCGLILNYVII
jgi:hypothetical protein